MIHTMFPSIPVIFLVSINILPKQSYSQSNFILPWKMETLILNAQSKIQNYIFICANVELS